MGAGCLAPGPLLSHHSAVPAPAATFDDYIAAFPPEVQTVLEKVRATVRRAVPGVRETISYRMPAFVLNGVVLYFAAFKNHIGLYPPVRGDARLVKAVARYAGEKGNLRFPLDQPIPYDLIARIATQRAKDNLAKTTSGPRTPSRKKR